MDLFYGDVFITSSQLFVSSTCRFRLSWLGCVRICTRYLGVQNRLCLLRGLYNRHLYKFRGHWFIIISKFNKVVLYKFAMLLLRSSTICERNLMLMIFYQWLSLKRQVLLIVSPESSNLSPFLPRNLSPSPTWQYVKVFLESRRCPSVPRH